MMVVVVGGKMLPGRLPVALGSRWSLVPNSPEIQEGS